MEGKARMKTRVYRGFSLLAVHYRPSPPSAFLCRVDLFSLFDHIPRRPPRIPQRCVFASVFASDEFAYDLRRVTASKAAVSLS